MLREIFGTQFSLNAHNHQSAIKMHFLGIRHHGTGSARRVLQRLEELRPDLVLVEGPPEFDPLLKWVDAASMKPPVALLGYNQDDPQQATFFPFAEYSPEWQAILYANTHKIPVRMMDLPLRYSFDSSFAAQVARDGGVHDPLLLLAQLDGFKDSEAWWERRFESAGSQTSSAQHFEAVMLAMTALRKAGVLSALEKENHFREAWMRQLMRTAQKEMYANVAVICGAWHAPALVDFAQNEKADKAILADLPKSKINIGATWVPWTNERLGMQSGYGAGVQSPGWSEYRWQFPDRVGEQWLSAVARLFRKKSMDISTAHVIETERLGMTLAAMRGLPAPTLDDYNEATATVMCMGDELLLNWVKKELTIGNRMGSIEGKMPLLPLQADFERQVKKLRIKQAPEPIEMEVDLRDPNHLEKSIFLHRVVALGIRWGDCRSDEKSKGTFREIWTLEWRPEILVDIVARGPWGNTVKEAATAWLTDRTRNAAVIGDLTILIAHAFPGELFEVTEFILQRLDEMAATTTDIPELMATIQPFIRTLRYGNVRNTDKAAVEHLLDGVIVRICAGLSVAAYQIDEDAAQNLFNLIHQTHDALHTFENETWTLQWLSALQQVDDKCHPLVAGCAARLLFVAGKLSPQATAVRFSRALSAGYDPEFSASWIEGFLKGAGVALLYDNQLWNILYEWTDTLPVDQFLPLLPVLRRTFSQYEPADRRRIGEKAKGGPAGVAGAQLVQTQELPDAEDFFSTEDAMAALTSAANILGYKIRVN